MGLIHRLALVAIALRVLTLTGSQVAPPTTAPAPADIDALVTRFVTRAEQYEKVFLNLTAEEKRIVEIFDQTGRLDKRREIVSDLVVYQSRDSEKEKTEYRDVRSVDGKPI